MARERIDPGWYNTCDKPPTVPFSGNSSSVKERKVFSFSSVIALPGKHFACYDGMKLTVIWEGDVADRYGEQDESSKPIKGKTEPTNLRERMLKLLSIARHHIPCLCGHN